MGFSMRRIMFIYRIVNSLNGKIYIGQTTQDIHTRFIQHKSAAKRNISRTVLALAINKYGSENFYIEVIDTANSLDDLNQKEKMWIEKENSYSPKGYNLHPGGDNHKLPEESLEKMRKTKLLNSSKGGSKSQYKGVSFNKKNKKYKVSSSIFGFGGYFDNEDVAAYAYDLMVLDSKKQAYVNFPNGAPLATVFEYNLIKKKQAEKTHGITFAKDTRKWQANLWIGTRCKYLGQYNTKEEAIDVYDNYVIANNLNKPLNRKV